MSVSVVQEKGVTVITVETDRTSMLPPLCQILKALCFSTRSCSLFRRADGLKQSNMISTLGAVQLMVGLFTIGLGPGRISLHPEDFAHWGVAYWLGGVFIANGIVSLLANRFSSWFSVGFSVLMNIVGFVLSIIGICFYVRDVVDITQFVEQMCNEEYRHGNRCTYMADFYRRMITGMDVTMIVLTALTLFVCICLAALGIRALCSLGRREQAEHDEIYHPEKEALLTDPGA